MLVFGAWLDREHPSAFGPSTAPSWTSARLDIRKGVKSVPVAEFWTHPIDGRQTGPVQEIALTATQPHFGGLRLWFVCPECERRCGRLYASDEDWDWQCRVCQGLVYKSQYRRENPLIRDLCRYAASRYGPAARHRRAERPSRARSNAVTCKELRRAVGAEWPLGMLLHPAVSRLPISEASEMIGLSTAEALGLLTEALTAMYGAAPQIVQNIAQEALGGMVPCPRCAGTTKDGDGPCRECAGRGEVYRPGDHEARRLILQICGFR